jgi:hypothetical protein
MNLGQPQNPQNHCLPHAVCHAGFNPAGRHRNFPIDKSRKKACSAEQAFLIQSLYFQPPADENFYCC